MGRMQLTLDSLSEFDYGKPSVAWQHALRAAVLDVLDRDGEKAARKVILTASITPIIEQVGDVSDVNIDFTITTKMPAMQTATRPVAVTKKGQLFFQEFAPDNPAQETLDQAGQ